MSDQNEHGQQMLLTVAGNSSDDGDTEGAAAEMDEAGDTGDEVEDTGEGLVDTMDMDVVEGALPTIVEEAGDEMVM